MRYNKREIEVTKTEYESRITETIDIDILLKYKKLWQQREDILNV